MNKILQMLSAFTIVLAVPFFTEASILPGNILQSALYYSDYSSNLFNWKYDTTTSTYYICDTQSAYCWLWNALFKIGYDSTLWVYHICEWSVWYCWISTDIFIIQDGYICPWNYSYCGAWNSLWVHPALIPIESMVSILEWDTSSVTKNLSKMNFSNWTYYICDGSVATCWNISDFIQVKYDSSNTTYYLCDWGAVACGSVSDFMQIKYDSSNTTYYVCDWDTVTCGSVSDFMQIKYDSSNSTYHVCGWNIVTCRSITDYLQIKKDGETYYTCNWNTVSCFVSTAVYQTIAEKSSSYNIDNSSKWNSVIVSEESRNMLSNKYDNARNLIEKWNYDEAIKLLNEILAYEWTIIWWDNYDLARKILSIAEEAKQKQNSSKTTEIKQYNNKNSELQDAIHWMYDNWLTMWNTLPEFLPYDNITREQASKFFVEFAAKVLWKDRWVVYNYDIFSDIKNANPTLKDYIIYANNMWLFKGNRWKFMPFNNLTKAQAIAVLIRLVDWMQDESWTIPYTDVNWDFSQHYWWYTQYLWHVTFYKIDKRWITSNIDKLDSDNINRGDLAILLYEMAMYLSNPDNIRL